MGIQEYKKRKHQVDAFIRRSQLNLSKAEKKKLNQIMRDAAMVGACAERDRTLELLRQGPVLPSRSALIDKICSKGILSVLGYEE